MKTRSSIILLIAFAFLSCTGQTTKTQTIPAAAFAEKIKSTPNPQLIDVRSPEEFNSGHIDNAANINWNGDDFEGKIKALDKSKPVFVYCMSGGRSHAAASKMEALGFTNITELQGGILKWNAAGLGKPTDKIIGMCPQEFGDLLKTDKKVLVDFYAEWCEPCKKMAPYLTQMQKDLADKVVIVRLNADENKTMINEMKIDELPAHFIYENGKITWKHTGFISEEDLKKQL
ncbi:thioredoxin domain-containing protein [Flavobacterium sp. 3HN19-14]|uniref:thioredoxin domain-containing protein n=1 Tax=Flavobacterium sp. 3HN19-14 TaxID=3448133 RepID=UPI003EE39CE5